MTYDKSSKIAGFFSIGILPYLAIAALSAGLYWQIRANGAKAAEIRAHVAAQQELVAANKRLQAESELQEVVIINNAAKRERIVEEKEVIKYRVREVITNAPAEDCLSQPVDAAVLDCLLNGSACDAAGDSIEAALDADAGR